MSDSIANATTGVFTKIKKLLALSQGKGTTEAEASLAAEHVQRLLQEHGLTLAQLEADSGDDGRAAKREKNQDHTAMYRYQVNLMEAIASGNFVLHTLRKVFVPNVSWGAELGVDPVTGETVRGKRSKRHFLIGRELNVQVTIQTYDYLTAELRRLNPYDHRSQDGKRFLEGASTRLAERLNERRREKERESADAKQRSAHHQGNGSGRELVLSDVYGSEDDLNNDALNNFAPGTTAANRRKAEETATRQREERDRLIAEGMDHTEATYRSWGYGPEEAAQLAASANRPGRRSRGGRGRGRTRSWTSSNWREHDKVNSSAYQAGRKAGASVGLDDQVGASRRKQLTWG
jgi:hypothetical protein